MSLRRVRVQQLPSPGPVPLPPAEAHHLVHVLRCGEGAEVVAFDGRGHQVRCRVTTSGQGVQIQAIDAPTQRTPTRPAHLALALLKPKALDLALRMAVEAGITHVHIYTAARSQNRPPRPDRWTKIAEAAAKQCGRADLPTLLVHASLMEALDSLAGMGLYIALPGAPSLKPPSSPASAIVGPEGGLTETEIEAALSAGAQPLGLGQWVLRAETAAILASGFISPTD